MSAGLVPYEERRERSLHPMDTDGAVRSARERLLRWKREDMAYGAATTAAAGLLLFLVAGNFGLLPSPLTPLDLRDGPAVQIPRVLALSADASEATNDPASSADGLIPSVGSRRSTPTPAVDDRAPSVTIEPPAMPVVVAGSQDVVMGSASDDVSGIARVVVTFVGIVGEMSSVSADLVCSSPLRCTWSAGAPAAADSYEIRAKAFDRAGHSADSDTVTVTVISGPPAAPGLLGYWLQLPVAA